MRRTREQILKDDQKLCQQAAWNLRKQLMKETDPAKMRRLCLRMAKLVAEGWNLPEEE